MINEEFRCIDDEVIAQENLIDIMFILGFRWPITTETAVNADLYCSQHQKMKEQHALLRPGAPRNLLLPDNTRPHVALATKDKLQAPDIEILPHPPCSPDIAPTDYHLFRSLQNSLKDMKPFRDNLIIQYSRKKIEDNIKT
uniref:Histone-lysine N-methyltransferase SETMAR n=1 Tax=Caenorhabditis japonica TaxID=281687 RepID=A0A8R1EIY6_CAEJA